MSVTAHAKPNLQPDTLDYYTVGIFDTDGLFRGKKMHPDKYASALEKGFGFCDVVFGWDMDDKLYTNTALTGWHTGFPDLQVQLDEQTTRDIPFAPQTQLVLGEATGPMARICPRNVLKRVLERAQSLGIYFKAAFEYEFFMFQETPESARAKNYQNLTPLSPGAFGYSVLRSGVHHQFQHGLWEMCEQMRLPLEGLHTETGPGVLEAALCVADALEACDRAALFKTFTKIFAQRQDLMATFMARWSLDVPGQSGHIHVSAQDENGKPLFYEPDGFSQTMMHFIAGMQEFMPEMTSVFAPTINAYTRLKPGFWAPTSTSWGVENRTTAIRAIPGSPSASRVEFRAAGADCNPYLSLAALLAAGLEGIENKRTPTAPVEGNAYALEKETTQPLPSHLAAAKNLTEQSSWLREYLGDAFVDHFCATREWECQEANAAITDWQLRRYFESI